MTKNDNWTPVTQETPDICGLYDVKCNDDTVFRAHLGRTGAWRHEEAGMYADLYPSKGHPEWTDPGGGSRNIQARQVTHWRLHNPFAPYRDGLQTIHPGLFMYI